MPDYAKVVVMGSPITKSNFKLHNRSGRAILPDNSGSYHDRYALYEETISVAARLQNPGITFKESLIAILRVYYKSDKRHPDTNNITKSIFDGIEKSGLIINDAQIRRLVIEEYYDKVEPRFELELFAESQFRMSYEIRRHDLSEEPILYEPPSNKKLTGLPKVTGFSEENLKKIKANLEKKQKDKDKVQETGRDNNASGNSDKGTNGPRASAPLKKSETAAVKSQHKASEAAENTQKVILHCSMCKKATAEGNYVKADGGKTIICRRCFKKLF